MTEREELDPIESLMAAIAALEGQRSTLGDTVVDASIAALRQQLAELEPAPPPEQQRKLVSVLFMDIVGSTQLTQGLDPEEVVEIIDTALKRLVAPVEEHGGQVTRYVGDGFKAVFGIPSAQENDPERAIRAGLAILEAAREYATELEETRHLSGFDVRVGINTGLVVVGGDTEGRSTVMGLPVNLAKRMESAAPPGGLLISHYTYRHVRGVFTVRPLEPVAVKGFAEPVPVYRVHRAKPRAFHRPTRGVEGVETRMIGRDAELEQLQDALYTAIEDGELHMVTLSGEAGVGKSRLLYEFEDWLDLQLQQVRYFKGRASQEMQNLPYALIRDLFSFRFQIQDSDALDVVRDKVEAGISETLAENEKSQIKAHVLGQFLGFDFSTSPHVRQIGDDAQQLHDRARIYLRQYFQAVAARQPAVVLLEDLHWADDSSLDLLTHLAQSLVEAGSPVPLLIVGAARPTLFQRRPHWGKGYAFHTHLELHPLPRRDGRRLVAEILQRVEQVPQTLRELVADRAEGNPFYTEELIKMLIEDGVIVRGPERWHVQPERLLEVRVPPTLTGVLQARLDSLPPEERTTLQQASVVGRIFWDDTVTHINERAPAGATPRGRPDAGAAPCDRPIPAALSALRDKELVFHRDGSAFAGTQEYIFKHAVLREVTYESVLKRLRRVYHGLVAEWLIEQSGERTGEYTGLIADHLELAGDVDRAITYLKRAGEQAAAQYAHAEAVAYFSRALHLAPEEDAEERYALLLAREQVYDLQGARQSQAQDLATLESLARALDEGRPQADGLEQARVALRKASYAFLTSDYPHAVASARAAVASARAAVASARAAVASARAAIASAKAAVAPAGAAMATAPAAQEMTGRTLDREAVRQEAGRLQSSGYYWWGKALGYQGKWQEAQLKLEQALALARAVGARQAEAASLQGLGNVSCSREDMTQAMAYWEQMLPLCREIGDRRAEATALHNLGFASTQHGSLTKARAYTEQALHIRREIGDELGANCTLGNLGGAFFLLGDSAKARACFEQIIPFIHKSGARDLESSGLNILAVLCLSRGDYDQATTCAQQARRIAREIGASIIEIDFYIDSLGPIRLSLGDYAGARGHLEQALRLGRDAASASHEGQALAFLSLISHYQGDDEAARECGRQARQLVQNMDNWRSQARTWTLLGHTLAGLAEWTEAAESYRQALAMWRKLGWANAPMEPLAGLARVALNQGDLPRAQAQVEEILTHLETGTLEVTYEPFRIYLTCYQVLQANGDPRAQQILATAHALLQEHAAGIGDEQLRHSFLHNVAAHREILDAFTSGG